MKNEKIEDFFLAMAKNLNSANEKKEKKFDNTEQELILKIERGDKLKFNNFLMWIWVKIFIDKEQIIYPREFYKMSSHLLSRQEISEWCKCLYDKGLIERQNKISYTINNNFRKFLWDNRYMIKDKK